jgi:hypothetical protein
MEDTRMQQYLRQLERELQRRGMASRETLDEVESHLLDSIEGGVRQGLSPEEAGRRAVLRFGPPRLVAAQFEKQRKHPMQKIYFAIALMVGFAILFVDSQPHWDDTGITVFALLACGGIIGLLSGKRPWLFALAIGLWLPAYYIITRQDFSMLITLLFPLVGAYAGWLVRRVLPRLSHPA